MKCTKPKDLILRLLLSINIIGLLIQYPNWVSIDKYGFSVTPGNHNPEEVLQYTRDIAKQYIFGGITIELLISIIVLVLVSKDDRKDKTQSDDNLDQSK